MNWKTNFVDLGEILESSSYKVNYESLKELDISSIVTGCGCSKAKYDKDKKILSVVYKPGRVNNYMRKRGFFANAVNIKVKYKNGEQDTLRLVSKVVTPEYKSRRYEKN